MMAIEIPNLWPLDAIKVDVRTPVDILRAQIGPLQQASKGMLEADVTSTETEENVSHQLDLVVPTLGNYRHWIVTIHHSRDMSYPVTVESIANVSAEEYMKSERRKTVQLVPPSVFLNQGETRQLTHQEQIIVSPQVYSEEDFFNKIRYIFGSEQVIAVIQSLLARIRETTPAASDEAPIQAG